MILLYYDAAGLGGAAQAEHEEHGEEVLPGDPTGVEEAGTRTSSVTLSFTLTPSLSHSFPHSFTLTP